LIGEGAFERQFVSILIKEQEYQSAIKSMRRDLGYYLQEASSITLIGEMFRDITTSQYLLEHDLIRFLSKYTFKSLNKAEGLMKRLDVNGDGMVDLEDIEAYITGHSCKKTLSAKPSSLAMRQVL
jgi:Ca2+-binding EF-hand superfamily protein